MLCTKRGYRSSVIFSLFAKSSARSKGILFMLVQVRCVCTHFECLPDTLEMHRSDLDHMSSLLTLKNTVATTTRHSSDIEKLGTINEVVVLPSCNADAIRLYLEAQATLVLPQSCSHSWLHTRRRNLSSSIVRLLRILLSASWWRLRI